QRLHSDPELPREPWRRKNLAHDGRSEELNESRLEIGILEFSLVLDHARERVVGQPFAPDLLERIGEQGQIAAAHRQTCRHRMTAELEQQARVTLRDEIECIAQMK